MGNQAYFCAAFSSAGVTSTFGTVRVSFSVYTPTLGTFTSFFSVVTSTLGAVTSYLAFLRLLHVAAHEGERSGGHQAGKNENGFTHG